MYPSKEAIRDIFDGQRTSDEALDQLIEYNYRIQFKSLIVIFGSKLM